MAVGGSGSKVLVGEGVAGGRELFVTAGGIGVARQIHRGLVANGLTKEEARIYQP